jgi:hypothetical protein
MIEMEVASSAVQKHTVPTCVISPPAGEYLSQAAMVGTPHF